MGVRGTIGKYSLLVTQECPMQNGGPSESDSSMKTIVLLFAVFKKHSPLILKVLTEKLWGLQVQRER